MVHGAYGFRRYGCVHFDRNITNCPHLRYFLFLPFLLSRQLARLWSSLDVNCIAWLSFLVEA